MLQVDALEVISGGVDVPGTTYDREAYLRRKARPDWREKQRQYEADARKRAPEKWRLKWRKAYQRTKTHRAEYTKAYRKRNPEATRAGKLKWQRDNRELLRERYRKRAMEHGEALKIKRALNYQKNRAVILARQKLARDQRTPEERALANAKLRDYYRRNRAREAPKRVAYAAARRFLKTSVTVDAKRITAWMQHMRSRPFCSCYYCGTVLTVDIHFDHVVALKRGGKHEIGNICTSCPSCNLSKSHRSFRVWPNKGQMFLDL